MYDRGGNAVDAAVATALVAGVIEPTETTLAGSGFMLLHHPEHGAISVDFGPIAPLSATEDMFEIDHSASSSNVLGLAPVIDNANVSGPRASGVPRTLYAILEAHERWGRLDRETVMAPAIKAAAEGFASDSWYIVNALQDLELLAKDPGSSATFLDDDGLPIGRKSAFAYGSSIDAAPLIKQPLLAKTLQTVSDRGHNDLIDGVTSKLLIETFKEYGMELTREDLLRIPPRIEEPRYLKFRDTTIAVPRAPGGGLTVLQILNVWQHLVPHPEQLNRQERIVALSRVMRHVFADRYHWLGDPDVKNIPLDALLSDKYAAHLAVICANDAWEDTEVGVAPWIRFAGESLHDPVQVVDGARGENWFSDGATETTSGTTHVSASDLDGWVVAITHTAANHFGSAVLCPRTGLLFDSAMAWFNARPGAANSIAGGARPVANMGPALVLGDDGRVVRAVGGSGGRRIISAVVQLIQGLVDDGLSIEEALAQPRIDGSGSSIVMHEFDADIARVEPELQPHLVLQHSLAFELDFARMNISEYSSGQGTTTAIEARAYDL